MNLLVTMVVLVISVWTAHDALAGCAWVVWIKHEVSYKWSATQGESSTTWELQGARETRSECEEVKGNLWSAMVKRYDDPSQLKGIEKVDTVANVSVFLTLKRDEKLYAGHENRTFFCLPDAVDPRDPKK